MALILIKGGITMGKLETELWKISRTLNALARRLDQVVAKAGEVEEKARRADGHCRKNRRPGRVPPMSSWLSSGQRRKG